MMTNRKAHKNSPHSALFKSSNLDDTRVLCHMDWLYVFNFCDIKLSLVKKIFKMIYYLPYTPEKRNYNVRKYTTHLWCGAQCVADQIWWAALCQKVQGPFLAPVRPWIKPINSAFYHVALQIENAL